MSGLGGVTPFTVSVNSLSPQSPVLRVGQLVEGVIQNTSKELLLLVGGRSIVLPPGTPLSQGQTVTAEVLRTAPSLQLRITPSTAQAPSVPVAPASSVSLAIMARLSPAALTARLNQVLDGTIQQTPQGPVFQSGLVSLPLASVPDYLVGATLSARVVETEQGPRLLVWQNTSAAGEVSPETHTLSTVLARVFQSLGRPDLAERIASLIPRALPPVDAGVRLVASLFLERGAGAELVDRLASMVRQGVSSGAISSDQERVLLSLLGRAVGSESKELQVALRVAAQSATRAPEAALARALLQSEAPGSLAEDLRTALHQLRSSEQFRSFLEKNGQLQEFNTASSRLIERVTANQLQNLRGLETSYLYFEPAFVPGSGLNSAHIHVFGDGGGKQSFPPDNSTVVLDISTTRLGELWITLSAVQGACSCVFRTPVPQVAELIDAHAADLSKLLSETAGYSQAQVRAVLWDGDRLSAAVDLFRPLEGINTEA